MTTVFFHAHPDDEAIFTGGTVARLVAAGERVVVAFATQGELGGVATTRVLETEAAAVVLGAPQVAFLGYHDSGLDEIAPDAFAAVPIDDAAARLARVLRESQANALIAYDEFGIYGHPDHVHVHRVAHRAAQLANVATVYECTVDHEYLHFVETHLVAEARAAAASTLGHEGATIGLPSVLITNTVDVRRVLDTKRAAMAAHASQIPETASAMQLGADDFAAVYGWEWFVRHGPPAAIDALA